MLTNPPKPLESQVSVGPLKTSSPNHLYQFFIGNGNDATTNQESDNMVITPTEK